MLSLSNVALRTALGATVLLAPRVSGPTPFAAVSGRLKVIDRGGQTAPDVQQAVVFLLPARGNPPAVAPGRAVAYSAWHASTVALLAAQVFSRKT